MIRLTPVLYLQILFISNSVFISIYLSMFFDIRNTQHILSMLYFILISWGIAIGLTIVSREQKRREEEQKKNLPQSFGITLVTKERFKQMDNYGPIDDDEYHSKEQLVSASIFMITGDTKYHPSDWNWWKWADKAHKKTDKMERLAIAAAFLVAEIDRLDDIENGRVKTE